MKELHNIKDDWDRASQKSIEQVIKKYFNWINSQISALYSICVLLVIALALVIYILSNNCKEQENKIDSLQQELNEIRYGV